MCVGMHRVIAHQDVASSRCTLHPMLQKGITEPVRRRVEHRRVQRGRMQLQRLPLVRRVRRVRLVFLTLLLLDLLLLLRMLLLRKLLLRMLLLMLRRLRRSFARNSCGHVLAVAPLCPGPVARPRMPPVVTFPVFGLVARKVLIHLRPREDRHCSLQGLATQAPPHAARTSHHTPLLLLLLLLLLHPRMYTDTNTETNISVLVSVFICGLCVGVICGLCVGVGVHSWMQRINTDTNTETNIYTHTGSDTDTEGHLRRR
jgi:hypothetical protein